MWKNKEAGRQKHYDCRSCRSSKRFDDLQCFWFGGEEQEVEISVDLKDESGNLKFKKGTKLLLDQEGLDNLIIEIGELLEKASPFEILQNVCPKVCPQSLLTSEIDEYIAMEAFCRTYHVPPLGAAVGYLDYTTLLRSIFATISITRDRVQSKEIQELKAKQ